MDDRWIVIPNWRRFQHYKDREPLWIKLYTDINSHPDWFGLSWAQRGILATVWAEYARSRGRLGVDHVRHLSTTWLRPGDIEALNHAGMIQFAASRPAAFPVALARSREVVLRTTKEASPQKAGGSPLAKRIPFAAPATLKGSVNMPAPNTETYVRGLVANHVITEPFELDDFDLDDQLRAELKAQLNG